MAIPDKQSPALFAPAASAAFGASIASALGMSLSPHEEQVFSGGEYIMRSLESVRGRAVYAVQCLFGDSSGSANDRLCQLLFFIGGLKGAGAGHITACIPYLAYARQDRHTEARDPVTTRYVAQLFEAMGVDRVLALEVHNLAAFDNAFRCETVHIDAGSLFVRHFAANSADHEYAVATPDIGGAKRARHFQELLQAALGRPVNFALMDKKRSHGIVSGTLFAGDVSGRHVIIFDDLISSGTTILRAVAACRRAGASRVDVAAAHASFAPEAQRLFDSDKSDPEKPDSVVVTDSVPLNEEFSLQLNRSLTVLSIAPAFAEAIRRLEQGDAV
ncbi:MAG: ribose-phosphate diphosphokinase [Steroidobacteraceae bacterium]